MNGRTVKFFSFSLYNKKKAVGQILTIYWSEEEGGWVQKERGVEREREREKGGRGKFKSRFDNDKTLIAIFCVTKFIYKGSRLFIRP